METMIAIVAVTIEISVGTALPPGNSTDASSNVDKRLDRTRRPVA
jgi:hypothetical protein